MKGRVRWYLGDRGYGLIESEQGALFFVDGSQVQGEPLKEGEEVLFELARGPWGEQASAVRRTES
jgi:CspA family cold shock protein